MNIPKTIESVVDTIEAGAAVLRVLSPVAQQIHDYIEGGPEAAVFEALPELRAPAALERAKRAARLNPA